VSWAFLAAGVLRPGGRCPRTGPAAGPVPGLWVQPRPPGVRTVAGL